MSEGRGRAMATVAFACAGFGVAYAMVRTLMALQGRRESPASVLWVEHSPQRWSLLIALWLAAMAALAGWLAVTRAPDRAPLWLSRIVVVALVAILAQGMLAP